MTFMAAEEEKQSVVYATMIKDEVVRHLIYLLLISSYTLQSNITPTWS